MNKDQEIFFMKLDDLHVHFDDELYEGIYDKTIKKIGLNRLIKDCAPIIDRISSELETLNKLLGDYIENNSKQ